MSVIKKHEQYKPCRECGFWVKVEDTYCPNCGIITPLWKIPLVHWHIPKKSILFGGGLYLCAKVLLMVWQQPGGGLISNLLSLIRGSVFTGLFFGAFVSTAGFLWNTVKQQRYTQSLQRFSASNLKASEHAIDQRLDEIRIRESRIQETLQDIGQTPAADQAQKSVEALKSSLTALQIQRNRYTAKSWEIKLLRWYNTLKPLTAETKKLTYDTCTARIGRLSETIKNGAEMLQSWKNKTGLTRTQQQCIIRLRKLLNACDQIHHDLLSYKAALAVQGVSPLDEHVQSEPAILTSLEELDVFSILPDIGEFTAGVKALDNEYFRLKGEEEVYQEFEKE